MELKPYVAEILAEIESEGEKAVEKYSEKYDDYRGPLRVEEGEYPKSEDISEEERKAIEAAIDRVRDHHERQKPDGDLYFQSGSIYGTLYRPMERVGIYVPGGKPLPSTLIMTGIPALLAGVDELIVTSPPSSHGDIDPYVLYVAEVLGIDELYRLGGVQAIGAMAYGAGLTSVDKIFGPGNKYVNEAKRQVYGQVGIDGLAGPSEVCIVADETADERHVLADLRSQLEHDRDSRAWLLTTSADLGRYCEDSGAKVEIRDDLPSCIERANDLAPEHLQIMTTGGEHLLDRVRNAGAVYLGTYTPAAAADYFLGVNHVLPTGGAAKFDSVLTVRDFMKPISVARTGKEEFRENCYIGKRLADLEGMSNHLKALEVRDDEETDRGS
ncbi:histidinol dehydrogenase [Candidatus Bipolaricaulota bacterium]|nr:histidinol dehydrogenase [Candidatus Bipolaricaulota bacterium]